MDPAERIKQIERRAKARKEDAAAENRRKFPVLNDPVIRDLCDCFDGRVVYVENRKGESMGKKSTR